MVIGPVNGILPHWHDYYSLLLFQGVKQAVEIAKTAEQWTVLSVVSVIAVLSVTGLYRIILYRHKAMLDQITKLENEKRELQAEKKALQDRVHDLLVQLAKK